MQMFAVRLNPDTRDGLPYSQYPTREEYKDIWDNSPMDGFHEAVNYLPENGVVRGYIPPRHLQVIRTDKPFILFAITAKTAKSGNNKIIGIQAGCKYEGETPRTGNNPIINSQRLTWHYYCPATLSMLLDDPISDARKILLGKSGSWSRGPTFQIKEGEQQRVLQRVSKGIMKPESRVKFRQIKKYIYDDPHSVSTQFDIDSTFDADVSRAFRTPLKTIKGNKCPAQKKIISFQWERDPRVAAYALKEANGVCQDCDRNAPFISKCTGLPYLEIHHIHMLKDGGSDTADNVIALCPNCHRARHYA